MNMTNSNTQLSEIEKEKELSEVKDDLFRKVGRNLINYQIIEQLLKQLILSSRISGPISQLEEIQKQKSEEVKVQTMGVLAGQLIENTYQKPKQSFNENVEIKGSS
jgi:cobalamin biosynthesis Co2+ chelatase CbiK